MPDTRRDSPVTAVELRPHDGRRRLPDRLRSGADRRAAELRPSAVPRRDDGRPVAGFEHLFDCISPASTRSRPSTSPRSTDDRRAAGVRERHRARRRPGQRRRQVLRLAPGPAALPGPDRDDDERAVRPPRGAAPRGAEVGLGWAVPEAVYVDFDVIRTAPAELNRSGVGDVLCYHTAHFDWKLAHDSGQEERRWPYDERLVDEAREQLDDRPRRSRRDPRVSATRGIRTLMLGPPLGWRRVPRRRLEHPPHGRRRPRLPVRPGAPDRSPLHPRPGRRAWHLPRRGPPGQRAGDRPRGAPSRRRRHPARGDGDRLGEPRTAMRRLAWYVRHADLPYTIADARPVTDDVVDDIRDRINATFGAWPAEGPAAPRGGFDLMHDRLRTEQVWTIGTLAGVVLIVAALARAAHRPRPRQPPAASTGGTSAPAASAGGAQRFPRQRCSGTKHVAIVNKDMTDDEIKAAIAERARSSSATGRTRRRTSSSTSSRSTSRTPTASTSS